MRIGLPQARLLIFHLVADLLMGEDKMKVATHLELLETRLLNRRASKYRDPQH